MHGISDGGLVPLDGRGCRKLRSDHRILAERTTSGAVSADVRVLVSVAMAMR
jgi:hypothetical protein